MIEDLQYYQKARPFSKWEPKDGTVLWWPIVGHHSVYAGTPLDDNWTDEWSEIYTKWTPILPPKEEESEKLQDLPDYNFAVFVWMQNSGYIFDFGGKDIRMRIYNTGSLDPSEYDITPPSSGIWIWESYKEKSLLRRPNAQEILNLCENRHIHHVTSSQASAIQPNWNLLSRDVVKRIRFLAAYSNTSDFSNQLHQIIWKDLVIPNLELLAQFCINISFEDFPPIDK